MFRIGLGAHYTPSVNYLWDCHHCGGCWWVSSTGPAVQGACRKVKQLSGKVLLLPGCERASQMGARDAGWRVGLRCSTLISCSFCLGVGGFPHEACEAGRQVALWGKAEEPEEIRHLEAPQRNPGLEGEGGVELALPGTAPPSGESGRGLRLLESAPCVEPTAAIRAPRGGAPAARRRAAT
ncbi:hypothetical protein NDU88_000686 [Pleurodeles waltl]|uniref:Uncharacterized protein n=1 Tax=Pleurodeles waltl TaxID=8319 RepID=A0AAV7TFN2_PLEWA|nr:hypothetical protein NDU88_000686 [Pleurodeles waltl]